MSLTIITERDRPDGRAVFYDGNGAPHGPGVVWNRCDNCGGDGVDYPDAERARECPACQGYGHIPYYRDSVRRP